MGELVVAFELTGARFKGWGLNGRVGLLGPNRARSCARVQCQILDRAGWCGACRGFEGRLGGAERR